MLFKKIYILIFLLLVSLAAIAAENVTIILDGVTGDIEKNILSSISLQKQKDHPRLSVSRIKSLHNKAQHEIKLALQALGYYRPKITTELKNVEGVWTAQYQINLGDPIKISVMDIQIEGDAAKDEAFAQLLPKLSLQKNAPLHHGQYESTKKDLLRLAAIRGYFDAEFTRNKVEVDLQAYQAKVTLHFDSGTRYRFGEIKYSDSPIRLDKLQNSQPFEEGDPYLNSQLISFQQSLANTDYFSEVEVQPLHDEMQNHSIPVQVSLVAKKRNRYTAGVGFGTDTGPRLKLGWSNRFNSQGHRMGADAKISPILSTLSTYYTIPNFRKKGAELGFNASLTREDTDTSKSNAAQIGINHRQKRWGWDETASINYLLENFEVSDTEQTSKSLIPSIGWSKTETDNTTYTNNGYRLGLNMRGSVESFLSDFSFFQIGLNGKYIRSFWDKGRIIARGNLSMTEVSDFNVLPTSLRYFTGGDNTIRGFEYEDLGPTDEKGNVIGGKYLLVGSLEYEHKIKEKWSVAGFVDAGNAFNKFGDEFEYGAGFGVRWLSPVGLIRVDLAMGVSDPDHPIRLHIVIGPDL